MKNPLFDLFKKISTLSALSVIAALESQISVFKQVWANTPIMDSSKAPDMCLSFATMLNRISGAHCSQWYRITINSNNELSDTNRSRLHAIYLKKHKNMRQKADKATKEHMKRLEVLSEISLHKHWGISCTDLVKVLNLFGVIKKKRFMTDVLMRILISHDIDAEVENIALKGTEGRIWYIRLGPKNDKYHKSAAKQIEADDHMPPRQNGIDGYCQKFLCDVRRTVYDSGAESSSESEEESAEPADDDKSEDDDQEKSIDKTINLYPIITSLGIDPDKLNSERVKLLIGELVKLQR